MMATGVKWLMPDCILHLHAVDEVTLEEIQQAITQAMDFIQANDQTLIHVLVDAKLARYPTLSVSACVEAIRPIITHPRCGWIVMVRNVNPFENFVALTAAQVFKTRFRSVDTMEEALEFLKMMAHSLPKEFNATDYV